MLQVILWVLSLEIVDLEGEKNNEEKEKKKNIYQINYWRWKNSWLAKAFKK